MQNIDELIEHIMFLHDCTYYDDSFKYPIYEPETIIQLLKELKANMEADDGWTKGEPKKHGRYLVDCGPYGVRIQQFGYEDNGGIVNKWGPYVPAHIEYYRKLPSPPKGEE